MHSNYGPVDPLPSDVLARLDHMIHSFLMQCRDAVVLLFVPCLATVDDVVHRDLPLVNNSNNGFMIVEGLIIVS